LTRLKLLNSRVVSMPDTNAAAAAAAAAAADAAAAAAAFGLM
jgi:hypothetical protein